MRSAIDVAEIVSRIDLGRFQIPLRIETLKAADEGWTVIIHARVPDRDRGRMIEVENSQYFYPDLAEAMGKSGVLDFVYRMLRDAVVHELNEWFRVDGVRVRDPHGAAQKTG